VWTSILVKQDSIQTSITHLYERFDGTGLPEELRDRFDFDLEPDLQNGIDMLVQLQH
jgi:hypothetical protein